VRLEMVENRALHNQKRIRHMRLERIAQVTHSSGPDRPWKALLVSR
jgi:hypothetical protein